LKGIGLKTIIIGAGLAGIAAGHRLKKDFLIFEKEKSPGGLCRTENCRGFIFDYTGHFLHLRTKEASDFFLAGKVRLKKVTRKAFIYSNGVYTGYPYQANYRGLPPETALENLKGFLDAKTGGRVSLENFHDWVLTALGRGNAKNFMFPYNRKLFKYPLRKLTLKWLGRFVPSPSAGEVMEGLMPAGREGMGYNSWFYYPEKGGI